ncbi:hypothetical protein E2C01_079250 [Portunus trituberculatus]|uniref:Uncharacterized protein n=1 Tax=Portunus trituberculatus TaxID=210409 RepID=A0A5B7IGH2_PORTR|nr:hypothetical protein [Portunus trituberculatus]
MPPKCPAISPSVTPSSAKKTMKSLTLETLLIKKAGETVSSLQAKRMQENETMKKALEEVKEDNNDDKKQVKKFELILNGNKEKAATDDKIELKMN